LKFDELMKRETGYCFSVLFLFIGYSSILHQRMKGNERKTANGTERKPQFPSAQRFSHCQKIVMKQ